MKNSSCIITSASNKFFPSLLNLLGSIKQNYPEHPDVYVYDLGLFFIFKKELESIPWVHVLKIPPFVSFWRSCYTWKTYILNTPLANLNLYLDAGCQILKPLTEVFEKIEKNDYLLVDQGSKVTLNDVTPKDYWKIFDLDEKKGQNKIIAAGIFGFKKDSRIKVATEKLYQAGLSGLCLGFSAGEQWKNKGKNKNIFVRNCRLFRHDTTLITLLVTKYLDNPTIEDVARFGGEKTGNSSQLIWNLRMNYQSLEYLYLFKLNPVTKIILFLFIKAKAINRLIKLKNRI